MSARFLIPLISQGNRLVLTLVKQQLKNESTKYLSTSTSLSGVASRLQFIEPKWWRRLLKMDWLAIERHKNKEIAYRLYVCCSDEVDYQKFFSYFNMEDTFNSMFRITELHIWMMSARMMQENKRGKQFRYDLIEAMWKDVEKRSKVLGFSVASKRREQIETLSEEFQAALFNYDEGLLSNDKVLASALWRHFLSQNSDNVEHVETLVSYVRRSMHCLDSVEHDDLLTKGTMKWPPLLENSSV